MKRFLEFSRAPFFSAIVVPTLLGTALAWRAAGSLSWTRFVLTLLGLVTAHAGANLLNDYFDHRLGADADNPYRGRFSGGSPHLVCGIEKPSTFFRYAGLSLAVAAACAAALAWIVDRGFGPVAWLALAGGFGGVFYTTPPLKLSYRGWGELTILACFGLLPVMGVYYVQTRAFAALPLVASLPPALLITNIIWINEFPDREPDARAGKRNLVVRLGTAAARYGYHSMAAGAYLLVAYLAGPSGFGPWAALGFVGLPLSAVAAAMLHRRHDQPEKLEPAQGLTVAAHLAAGLGLCAGILIGA